VREVFDYNYSVHTGKPWLTRFDPNVVTESSLYFDLAVVVVLVNTVAFATSAARGLVCSYM
jgi:hypothetical protein